MIWQTAAQMVSQM